MSSSRLSDDNSTGGLISLRAAVILALETMIAAVVAWLTSLTGQPMQTDLLAAGAAWASSVTLLGQLIQRDGKRPG